LARPKKQTVDYFPHDCNHKTTIFILEENYGNNGYAFWFKILELLSSTEGHYYDCKNPHKWKFLQAKTHLEENMCIEILGLLAELGAIDSKLWKDKVIWSDNFISRIADVYKNRRVGIPTKPNFYKQKPEQDGVSTDINPQTKLKETKLKETKPKDIYVWEKYKEIFKDFYKRKPELTPKRKSHIKARLEKFTADELIETMKRIRESKYHIGENPSNKFYATPDYCFRNNEQIENWLNSKGQKAQNKWDAVKERIRKEKEAEND